jgi:PAS domain S-box-containing protein
MTLRRRLVVLFLVLSVVLSGIVFVGFELSKHSVAETRSNQLDRKPIEIANSLEAQFDGVKRTTRLWAENPAVAAHGSDSQRRALEQFVEETAFDGVSVIARNGTMTAIVADLDPETRSRLVGREFSDRTYFRRARAGQTYVSDPVTATSGNYIVTISTPIYRNGTVVGTLNAALHLRDGGFFGIVDSIAGANQGVVVESRSGEVIYERRPTPDADLMVANATLEQGWTVRVESSRAVFAGRLQSITYRQLGAVTLVLAFLGGYGWLFYSRILRYHEALLDGFEALKRNEYDHRIDIDTLSEWDRLTSGFNETSRRLENYERERRERELELRRFKRAVEATGHAVFITDTDGTIEYVNPAFEQITGYGAGDAIGENSRILQSGEMSDAYYEEMWETIVSGEIWTEEVVDQRSDGELYHAYQTVAPIPDEDGEVTAFVAIQTDITDRKRLEDDLRESLRRLRVLDRVLRHNLRNDMNVVEGYAQTIEASSEGALAEHAAKIRETSRRLRRITDKQREITKFLSDPPEPEFVDLASVVATLAADARDRHPEADVSVDAPETCRLRTTPAVEKALDELLENAVVHTDRDRPSVDLRIDRGNDAVAISVADDGPGIPAMEREILTDEAEIDPLYHGSGLGLWLVNLVVQQSGSEVAYEENEPRGSVVTITLPTVSS